MAKCISVIIPVYNAEAFISDTARSVLKSRAQDFELILSDDGSTDRSGEICDRIAASDRRVRVLHSENKGVSAARNRGMEAAEGTYVFFLDADDALADDAIDFILHTARHDAEGKIKFDGFAYTSEYPDGREKAEFFPFKGLKCSDPSVLRKLLFGTPLLNTCWGKLFRLEEIRKTGLRFPETLAIGEDYAFVMRYLCSIADGSMCLTNKAVVMYRQNRNGAVRTLNLKKHIAGLRYIWRAGLELTKHPAFSAYREMFSLQQFGTLMYEFRLIVSQYDKKKAVRVINAILKLSFIREIVAYASSAAGAGHRKAEITITASGRPEIIYAYIKLKILIRKALQKE